MNLPKNILFLTLFLFWNGAFSLSPLQKLDSLFASFHVYEITDSLQSRGLKPGEGLKVAIIDEGFSFQNLALTHFNTQNLLSDSWDYVLSQKLIETPLAINSNSEGSHGTQVLAYVASRDTLANGRFTGLLPYAQYYLYKTENNAIEDSSEERSLAQALFRGESLGVNLINISLGYRYQFDNLPDHDFMSMNGITWPASVQAQKTAQSAFVFVAMGNEQRFNGNTPTLNSPADADHVISVGALSAFNTPCDFSSFGPTSDGRIKPDLTVMGCEIPVLNSQQKSGWTLSSGTSYASPILMGLVGLLKQGFPLHSVSEIIDALKKSATNTLAPNSQIGWGSPDLLRAWNILAQKNNLKKTNGFLHKITLTQDKILIDGSLDLQIQFFDLSGSEIFIPVLHLGKSFQIERNNLPKKLMIMRLNQKESMLIPMLF
jgi:serine protease AprX